jgi:hypothetical protein
MRAHVRRITLTVTKFLVRPYPRLNAPKNCHQFLSLVCRLDRVRTWSILIRFCTFITIGSLLNTVPLAHAQFGPEIKDVNVKQAMQDFGAIEKVAAQVTELCPPADCFYIGVGRSPTPIVAMLQAKLGNSSAINLPLSSMEGFANGSTMRGSDAPVTLAKTEIERLNLHFDHFVPSESVLKGRRIMLVDFASTGESLNNTRTQLNNYLSANHRSTQVEAAAIPENEISINNLKSMKINVLKADSRLTERLIGHQYKNLAEYEKFEALQWRSKRSLKTDAAEMPPYFREYTPPDKITQTSKKAAAIAEQQHSSIWNSDTAYNRESWAVKRRADEMKRIEGMEGYENLVDAFRSKLQPTPKAEAMTKISETIRSPSSGQFIRFESLSKSERLKIIDESVKIGTITSDEAALLRGSSTALRVLRVGVEVAGVVGIVLVVADSIHSGVKDYKNGDSLPGALGTATCKAIDDLTFDIYCSGVKLVTNAPTIVKSALTVIGNSPDFEGSYLWQAAHSDQMEKQKRERAAVVESCEMMKSSGSLAYKNSDCSYYYNHDVPVANESQSLGPASVAH